MRAALAPRAMEQRRRLGPATTAGSTATIRQRHNTAVMVVNYGDRRSPNWYRLGPKG
jgi:hypothetical protein